MRFQPVKRKKENNRGTGSSNIVDEKENYKAASSNISNTFELRYLKSEVSRTKSRMDIVGLLETNRKLRIQVIQFKASLYHEQELNKRKRKLLLERNYRVPLATTTTSTNIIFRKEREPFLSACTNVEEVSEELGIQASQQELQIEGEQTNVVPALTSAEVPKSEHSYPEQNSAISEAAERVKEDEMETNDVASFDPIKCPEESLTQVVSETKQADATDQESDEAIESCESHEVVRQVEGEHTIGEKPSSEDEITHQVVAVKDSGKEHSNGTTPDDLDVDMPTESLVREKLGEEVVTEPITEIGMVSSTDEDTKDDTCTVSLELSENGVPANKDPEEFNKHQLGALGTVIGPDLDVDYGEDMIIESTKEFGDISPVSTKPHFKVEEDNLDQEEDNLEQGDAPQVDFKLSETEGSNKESTLIETSSNVRFVNSRRGRSHGNQCDSLEEAMGFESMSYDSGIVLNDSDNPTTEEKESVDIDINENGEIGENSNNVAIDDNHCTIEAMGFKNTSDDSGIVLNDSVNPIIEGKENIDIDREESTSTDSAEVSDANLSPTPKMGHLDEHEESINEIGENGDIVAIDDNDEKIEIVKPSLKATVSLKISKDLSPSTPPKRITRSQVRKCSAEKASPLPSSTRKQTACTDMPCSSATKSSKKDVVSSKKKAEIRSTEQKRLLRSATRTQKLDTKKSEEKEGNLSFDSMTTITSPGDVDMSSASMRLSFGDGYIPSSKNEVLNTSIATVSSSSTGVSQRSESSLSYSVSNDGRESQKRTKKEVKRRKKHAGLQGELFSAFQPPKLKKRRK